MPNLKLPKNVTHIVVMSTAIAAGLYAISLWFAVAISPWLILLIAVGNAAWEWRTAVQEAARTAPPSAEEIAQGLHWTAARGLALAGIMLVMGTRILLMPRGGTQQIGLVIVIFALAWSATQFYAAHSTVFTASGQRFANAAEAITKDFRGGIPMLCLKALVVGMVVGFAFLVLLGVSALVMILEPVIADKSTRYFTNLAIGMAATLALAYPVLDRWVVRRATRRFSAAIDLQAAKSLQGYPPIWERR
jgi:hypothetical protein